MKNKRILMLAAIVAVSVSCSLIAETLSLIEGKEAKVCVRVVDTEGNPVPDAKITARFRFIDLGVLNNVEYVTDKDGCATVCGRCVDGVSFEVTKPGWYEGYGGQYFLTGADDKPMPEYKDGKWLPYGETEEIVLKKEKEPVPMIVTGLLEFCTPEANKDYGWDAKIGSLVEPYGKGKVADFYIRHTKEVNMETGIKKSFTLTFPNCLDGYYILDRDPSSELTVPHRADPNAKYEKEFTLRFEWSPDLDYFKRHPGIYTREESEPPYYYLGYYFNHMLKKTLDETFSDRKVIIMRTRTKVNEEGMLISAYYSMMYGEIIMQNGPTSIQKAPLLYFNPYENNMSLEYSKEETTKYIIEQKEQEERRKLEERQKMELEEQQKSL